MDEVSPENNEEAFKIITLGDSAVGKTSIIQRFVFDDFNPDQLSYLDISHSFRVLNINQKKIKLNLIDTNGQEKYRSLSVSYFKHVDVVLFFFDLNLEDSFDNIQYWIDLFKENEDIKNIKGKYLIGNKSDLEQKVKQGLIDELVKKNGLIYMSTSAKTKSQIDEMFEYIAAELYEYSKNHENDKKGKNTKKEKILLKGNDEKTRKCCS